MRYSTTQVAKLVKLQQPNIQKLISEKKIPFRPIALVGGCGSDFGRKGMWREYTSCSRCAEKGETMRKRISGHQTGHIFRSGRWWFGRWRRDELVKGDEGESRVVRKQHCEKLAEYSDRYRCKKDVK